MSSSCYALATYYALHNRGLIGGDKLVEVIRRFQQYGKLSNSFLAINAILKEYGVQTRAYESSLEHLTTVGTKHIIQVKLGNGELHFIYSDEMGSNGMRVWDNQLFELGQKVSFDAVRPIYTGFALTILEDDKP